MLDRHSVAAAATVAVALDTPGAFQAHLKLNFVMLTSIFQKRIRSRLRRFRQKLADKMGLILNRFTQNHRATMKIGGIHVLKPKRGNSASLNGDKKRASLSPLSSDSPYFYVRDGGAVVSKLQPIPLQF